MSLAPLELPREARPYDVLCLGLNACDHICLVPGPPPRGGKLRMRRMVTTGGGQAATAACALARLGWRVAYAGVCGDDEAGRRVEPWLRAFGVESVGLVVRPGTGSQRAFIMVEEGSGERTIVWYRDQDCVLRPEDLDPRLIASARVLHLDGHFLEASLAAARLAREHGTLVSLDGERVHPGSRELAALCQVVVGSRRYPRRLTGVEDPARAVAQIAALGPRWAGYTDGERGAWLWVEGRLLHQPAFTVQAVDTTGAGDVFHAGLVHAILLGRGPEEALRTACGLAALSVTALGGRGRLATRDELERFLERQP